MNDASEAPVVFEERECSHGRRIGIAMLNAPSTLNGLSLAMVDALHRQLDAWAADPSMAVVVLRGAGDKAFCAGGDLHGLYRSMLAAPSGDPTANAYARDFFAREYRLDYRIHAYPKPILCWGHGIVMGGGIGLMSGASHRVVTQASRLAMPEIGIGLFPDVGGSWLLNRVPGRGGRFLALTGAHIGAADAIYAGFADYAIDHSRYDDLLQALVSVDWQGARSYDDARLSAVLHEFPLETSPGPLQRHRALIDAICGHARLEDAVAAIAALANDDPWLSRAASGLANGCPGSIRLSWELQERSLRLSLAEVFRLEYIAALHCAAHGDFAEGIRALLIDKDKRPHWNPSTSEQADAAWAERFFIAPWPQGDHPLAGLGQDDPQRSQLA